MLGVQNGELLLSNQHLCYQASYKKGDQVLKSIHKIVLPKNRQSVYANGSEQKPQPFTTHWRHVQSCYIASQRWHLWFGKRWYSPLSSFQVWPGVARHIPSSQSVSQKTLTVHSIWPAYLMRWRLSRASCNVLKCPLIWYTPQRSTVILSVGAKQIFSPYGALLWYSQWQFTVRCW